MNNFMYDVYKELIAKEIKEIEFGTMYNLPITITTAIYSLGAYSTQVFRSYSEDQLSKTEYEELSEKIGHWFIECYHIITNMIGCHQ